MTFTDKLLAPLSAERLARRVHKGHYRGFGSYKGNDSFWGQVNEFSRYLSAEKGIVVDVKTAGMKIYSSSLDDETKEVARMICYLRAMRVILDHLGYRRSITDYMSRVTQYLDQRASSAQKAAAMELVGDWSF